MNHIDLFSGIGGFALAAQQVWGKEYETVAFCDNDRFCQQVLRKRFPNVPIYDDIRELTKERFITDTNSRRLERTKEVRRDSFDVERGLVIDLLTAGVPCQPASQAGKRRGTKDDRWLWPETFRLIRETQPRWVILENVRGILTLEGGLVFQSLLTEMENIGYETRTYIIPACAVNAPHRRDRVWFVAYSRRGNGQRGFKPGERKAKIGSGNDGQLKQSTEDGGAGVNSDCHNKGWDKNWLEVATELCGVDDGLPAELDGLKLSKARHRVERLKALGNAIVPQVAFEIMKAIKEVTND